MELQFSHGKKSVMISGSCILLKYRFLIYISACTDWYLTAWKSLNLLAGMTIINLISELKTGFEPTHSSQGTWLEYCEHVVGSKPFQIS